MLPARHKSNDPSGNRNGVRYCFFHAAQAALKPESCLLTQYINIGDAPSSTNRLAVRLILDAIFIPNAPVVTKRKTRKTRVTLLKNSFRNTCSSLSIYKSDLTNIFVPQSFKSFQKKPLRIKSSSQSRRFQRDETVLCCFHTDSKRRGVRRQLLTVKDAESQELKS